MRQGKEKELWNIISGVENSLLKILLHFRLRTFRRVLDAELRECCADGKGQRTFQ